MRSKENSPDFACASLFRAEVTIDLLLVKSNAALFREDTRGVHHPLRVLPHDGEPVIEALVRAAEEHLAVVIKPEDVSLAHVVQDLSRNGLLGLLFIASRWEGDPANSGPEMVTNLCWLPLRELPQSVSPRVSWALRQHLSGARFSTTAFGDGLQEGTERLLTFRSDVAKAVASFHEAFDLPRQASPSTAVDDALANLRIALMEEEFGELVEAVSQDDLVAIADALADVVYVAYGTALTYGVDLDAVLCEVHRANMSKLDADGQPIRRADGKVLKSDRYFPPDVAAVLGRSSTSANYSKRK
jgi:predicted HAD superfamily Cof-like phosphohydrolase